MGQLMFIHIVQQSEGLIVFIWVWCGTCYCFVYEINITYRTDIIDEYSIVKTIIIKYVVSIISIKKNTRNIIYYKISYNYK